MGGEIQRGSLTHDMGYSLKAQCIGKQTTAAATAQESSESLHTCSSHFQPSKRTNKTTTFTPPQTPRLFNEGGGYSFRAQQSTPNQSKQQQQEKTQFTKIQLEKFKTNKNYYNHTCLSVNHPWAKTTTHPSSATTTLQ